MKMRTVFLLGIALGLLQPALGQANELFQISWKGKIYFTDGTGKVVSKPFSDKDVVRVIAQNNGLNPNDLVLVYRPNAFDTAVVFKSTGAVVADYQQLPDVTQPDQRTDVTSSDGVTTVRHSFLFDERHGISPGQQIGSIFGTEKQKRDPNDGEKVLSESFHGNFQFSIREANNPDWQQGVYTGTFSTGKRIVDTTVN
jgi:hypothetical protein